MCARECVSDGWQNERQFSSEGELIWTMIFDASKEIATKHIIHLHEEARNTACNNDVGPH